MSSFVKIQGRNVSRRWLAKNGGAPLPAPKPVFQKGEREMFAVYRKDWPHCMAIFANDSWAVAWVRSLSRPFDHYEIRPIKDPT